MSKKRSAWNGAISLLIMGVLCFVGLIIASFVALCAGFILNRFGSVGLFPGSMLFLATSGVVAIGIGLVFNNNNLEALAPYYETELEDDEETAWLEEASNSVRTFLRPEDKIGRNTLCRCGSRRKYKNCCLRNSKPAQSDAELPF